MMPSCVNFEAAFQQSEEMTQTLIVPFWRWEDKNYPTPTVDVEHDE